MNQQTHQEVEIEQAPLEDLVINEAQGAEVVGGTIRPSNTYTGTTQIQSGTL